MSGEPTRPEVRVLNTVKTLLGVLVVIVSAYAMKVMASVMIPLVLAIFLTYFLAPLMDWFARHRVPNALTLPATLVALFGVLFVVQVFIVESVEQIADRAPFYTWRLQELAVRAMDQLPGEHAQDMAEDWISQLSGAASEMVVNFFGSLINFAANLVLVATYMVFMLLGRASLVDRVMRAFPKDRADGIRSIFVEVNLQVQRYIVAKVLISLGTALCMYVALVAFGVDFALFWGMLAFLLTFIPTVGSAVAAILPITLAALQFHSWVQVLGVALTLIAIQQIIGNFIEPIVQGRSLNLNPIVVLFALVFFGWLWGFWGMVLSVPMAAVIKIIMEHNRSLKPIAVLIEK